MEQKSFASAIEQICEEKGISKEKVLETIEMALAAAYKKEYGRKGQNIRVKFDLETGQMKVFQVKLVVDQSMLKEESPEEKAALESEKEKEEEESEEEKKIRFNPEKHIMVEEANKLKGIKKTKKEFRPGDEIEFPLEVTHDFGRIAAQTAKQVIIQRIREAEREAVFDEYKEKEGQVVSGIVQRIEGENVFLDIGKTTGVLFPEDQISNERYRIGQRLKVYVVEVQKDSRGPTINLSRTHPKMVSQLFALEVPEISSGTVEIKSIAREAGSRSKIAVSTNEERVDPIGSMIGQKGTRVQAVINELAGEKIDIVQWSEDPAEFISASLSPAKVIDVQIDKNKNQATVIVPEDQLSLAIGVKGQNARLAAKLTGWKIDIITQKKTKKPTKEPTKEKQKKKRKTKTESKKEKKTSVKEQKEEKPKKKKTTKTKKETGNKEKTKSAKATKKEEEKKEQK
jgi:N utilization substance protein A